MSRPSKNTDRLLIEAAKELIPEAGFKGLKIREVARKAGVNLGMFNYHFKTKEKFLITKDDFDSLKDKKLYRLMDCLNFTKKGKDFVFDSAEYEKYKDKGEKIMHWLPDDGKNIEVSVLMPDNKKIKGFAEESIKEMGEGDICQFERFGFVRLDSKKNMEFWFGHK